MNDREEWIQKYIQKQIEGMVFRSEVERQHMIQNARQSAEAYLQTYQGQSRGNPKLVIPPIVPTPKVYPGEPLPPVIFRARGNPQQQTNVLGIPIEEIMKYERLEDERFQALKISKERAKYYYEQMKRMKVTYPNIGNALREYNRQIDEVLERMR